MSSFTVTIVVPTAENETVFLLHVVQAALKAYRKRHNSSDSSDEADDRGLAKATDEADRTTETFGQHPIAIA
ncbi:MAG TPA: hypothetical protein VFV92_12285 [Candidatus Bathyarchaeia archaeon]|nr:hypothetical protein [Candidatus Bathyarchaeia archaeon]